MNTLLTYIFADLIYVVLALNNKIKFPQNVILAKLRKFAPQNLSYFGRKTSENKINFFHKIMLLYSSSFSWTSLQMSFSQHKIYFSCYFLVILLPLGTTHPEHEFCKIYNTGCNCKNKLFEIHCFLFPQNFMQAKMYAHKEDWVIRKKLSSKVTTPEIAAKDIEYIYLQEIVSLVEEFYIYNSIILYLDHSFEIKISSSLDR